ncbi:MAG TPA: hypothetical protein VHA09_05605 [Nitrososphaera sp.]|nr:hypothetical protein [Nitrososphaera sp.]
MKLFSFNAGSFTLDTNVENLLMSKGAIVLDFGTSAYINSDSMPAILSELAAAVQPSNIDSSSTNEALIARLRAEIVRFGTERQKLMDENARLVSRLQIHASESASLEAQVSAAAITIETLKAEIARLKISLKNAPPVPQVAAVPADASIKQAYEKLQKELQSLRAQNAETITSLKVLEDENDDLHEEVEMLRSQVKNAPVPKA